MHKIRLRAIGKIHPFSLHLLFTKKIGKAFFNNKITKMDINNLLIQAGNLEKQGETKAAIEKYKEILSIDAKHIHAQFKIGELYHQLGELPAALSAYYHTTDLEPNHKKAIVKIEMIKSILDFFNPDLYNP